MNNQNQLQYHTTVADDHWREEEYQWARILATGHPARGMALLYIQKACTAFHEFEPAWRAGALRPELLDFYRRRLATRIEHVLVTMKNNNLDNLGGVAELTEILRTVETARTPAELADLAEEVHAVNHLLLDYLEKLGRENT